MIRKIQWMRLQVFLYLHRPLTPGKYPFIVVSGLSAAVSIAALGMLLTFLGFSLTGRLLVDPITHQVEWAAFPRLLPMVFWPFFTLTLCLVVYQFTFFYRLMVSHIFTRPQYVSCRNNILFGGIALSVGIPAFLHFLLSSLVHLHFSSSISFLMGLSFLIFGFNAMTHPLFQRAIYRSLDPTLFDARAHAHDQYRALKEQCELDFNLPKTVPSVKALSSKRL